MNILITGGCGYVGTVLTNRLLQLNHQITIIDTQWFGNYLNQNKKLEVIKDDIRNIAKYDFKNFEIVIHLANIANDPAVELDPNLSWEVNCLATQQIIDKCVRDNVKQFIYASSGSVYGVKEESEVTEDLTLVPISTYNKTKMIAERIFLSYQDNFKIHIIRPATVCGFSDRMRLDLTVNILTFQALQNKLMTVFGGSQIRPNIHIKDMVRVYEHFLMNKNIKSGFYNAGFENLKVIEIAQKIQSKIKAKIKISKSNDLRSYRLDSSKLLNTNFKPKYTVDYGIEELIEAHKLNNLKNYKSSYTVQWMQKKKIK